MRVKERHGGCGLFGVLELFYTHFQPGDVLSHELRSRFALSIVVLAAVRLLGANTLCAGRLCAVTSLVRKETRIGHGWKREGEGRGERTILRLRHRRQAFPEQRRRWVGGG